MILLKGKKLERKVNFFFERKLLNLSPLLNKPMQIKCITEGAWRQSPRTKRVAENLQWWGGCFGEVKPN